MARIQLRLGDTGDVPVTYQGNTLQQLISFGDAGTVTVTTTNCSLYVFRNGVEVMKVPRNSTGSLTVQAGDTYDVKVAGTTVAQPNGSVHYDFHA